MTIADSTSFFRCANSLLSIVAFCVFFVKPTQVGFLTKRRVVHSQLLRFFFFVWSSFLFLFNSEQHRTLVILYPVLTACRIEDITTILFFDRYCLSFPLAFFFFAQLAFFFFFFCYLSVFLKLTKNKKQGKAPQKKRLKYIFRFALRIEHSHTFFSFVFCSRR